MKSVRPTSQNPKLFVCLAVLFCLLIATIGPFVVVQGKNDDRGTASVVQRSSLWESSKRSFASFFAMFQGGGPQSVPGTGLPDLDAARVIPFADPVTPAAIVSEQACTDCTPCPTCGPGTSNHAPIVNADGPYYGTTGSAMTVNGLKSFDVDPADRITNYAWNFGDNTGVSNGATPSHTYQNPGNYTISLTVTDSHSATSNATTSVYITAAPPAVPPSGTTQGNGAQFISQSVPTTMTTGQTYPVSVTMRNVGTTTWTAAHLYRLGSQNPQDNTQWGRSRVYLPNSVAPGADVTFNFTVVAPFGGYEEAPPTYFQWRMVEDGVEWFGEPTTNQLVYTESDFPVFYPDGMQSGPYSDLFASRIAPEHRIGEAGEDLYSGNFNLGLGLVDLAGRSGLNLNLGLGYNSLATWTKVIPPFSGLTPPRFQQPDSYTFDADRGFPSVGFQLGFPSIQGPFYNNQTEHMSYLALMPSGSRVDLRQVGETNVYEAVDSSYLQLLDGGNGSVLLRTTDGTQMAYWSINNEYRCTEIKDRNGNYITIKYDPIGGTSNLGRMTSIIDTLGRTVNFNYDANYRLQSITQPGTGGQTHVWATFGYASLQIQTNFVAGFGPTPVVTGLPANHIISVLTQVGLDDGSRYNFDYTSWGQVYRIRHAAADGHQLSYRSYNLPLDASSTQTDCPHFSQRQDWAENWNNNNPAFTNFQIAYDQPWGQVTTAPGSLDEVTYKEFFTSDSLEENSGWARGLVRKTEIYSSDSSTVPKKTTVTTWTQDDTRLAYPLNPRPAAITISDAEGNRRRTTMEYTSFGLPSDTYEWGPYGTDDWRVLRRTHTDYNLSTPYVNRRILGLVSGQYVFAPDIANSSSTQTLMAKTTVEYDMSGLSSALCNLRLSPDIEAPVDPVIHHDPAYNTLFVAGRGLVSQINRWDAFDETNAAKITNTTLFYNIYGSISVQTDAAGHSTQIEYCDLFSNDGVSDDPAPYVTAAFPSFIEDPDGFVTETKYNYDLGKLTRQEDPKGAAQTTTYDAAGRIKQTTNSVNGAYSRFVYPASQTIINQFSTINDLQHEAYGATISDGAGRVRAVASDFPNSIGNYSGQFTLYDVLGRTIQQTNPTEINHAWAASGDDDPNNNGYGWMHTSQTYDWKGRPLRSTNQDGTYKEASYSGCGCAGDDVVTLTDEGTLLNGQTARRRQRIYSDVLGRSVKTEVLDWEGAIYSTTLNFYNAQDQLTGSRDFAGDATSQIYQDTNQTYDGYGRLKTRHEAQQDAGKSATWTYNNDDTIHSIADARGSISTYSYNNRRLVTNIVYGVDGTAPPGIVATAPISFTYDSTGNNTSVRDGSGKAIFSYDQLSRLILEIHDINGLGSGYQTTYDYNLAGQLTTLVYPNNVRIDYTRNVTWQSTAVTSPGFGVYISDLQYRASGAPKSIHYGNDELLQLTYTSRLQLQRYNLKSYVFQGQRYDHLLVQQDYTDDGYKSYSHDLAEPQFDRQTHIDFANRLSELQSSPVSQVYQYDRFHNVTQRQNRYWSRSDTFTANYVNDRNQGWHYDEDGRLTSDNEVEYNFDLRGTNVSLRTLADNSTVTQVVDANGDLIKRTQLTGTTFYVRSRVLGGKVLAEYNQFGTWQKNNIYLDDELLATQDANNTFWQHHNPLTGGRGLSTSQGIFWRTAEVDSMDVNVGMTDPYVEPAEEPHDPDLASLYPGVEFPDGHCRLNGIVFPCASAIRMVSSGSATRCPNDDCGPQFDGKRWRVLTYTDEGLTYVGMAAAGAFRKKKPPTLKLLEPWQRAQMKKIRDAGGLNPYRIDQDENTPFDEKTISAWVMQALQQPDCIEFYTTVLTGVSNHSNPALHGGDLQHIFTDFMNQKVGGFTRTPLREEPANGYAMGVIGHDGGARISLGEQRQPYQTFWDAYFTIGELFHVSGSKSTYSDEVLAKYVHFNTRYGKDENRSIRPEENIFSPRYQNQKDGAEYGYSTYFHRIQQSVCFVPSQSL